MKTSFVKPVMLKARANKTAFDIMIVHFYIRKKLDIVKLIQDFSVWLRTGFNSHLQISRAPKN